MKRLPLRETSAGKLISCFGIRTSVKCTLFTILINTIQRHAKVFINTFVRISDKTHVLQHIRFHRKNINYIGFDKNN